MASTKVTIREQVLRRLSAGNPSVASKVHPLEIDKAVEQVLNGMLRVQHLEILQLDDTIPTGSMLAFYENVPVTSYNGVSKCTLPAIPVSLIKGMGVFSIRPHHEEAAPTQLDTPTLSATAASHTQINLSCTPVTGATTYVFQQKIGDNWTNIQSGTGRTKVVTGLTATTLYEFRVNAIGGGYIDSNYSEASATTQATPVQRIVVTISGITDSGATATWASVTGAASYKVEIGTNGSTANVTEWVYEPAHTKTYTGLSASTTQYVRVTPFDADNNEMSAYQSLWAQFATTAAPVSTIVPTDLPNLWAWYDAAQGVSGTTQVTAWADQSGNGRNLAYDTYMPTLVSGAVNGKPAIGAVANDDFITGCLKGSDNLPDPNTQNITVYMVAKQRASYGFNGAIISTWLTNNFRGLLIRRDSTNNSLVAAAGTFFNGSNGSAITANVTPDVFSTIRFRVDATKNYLSLNNGSELSVTKDTLYVEYTPQPIGILSNGAGYYANAEIAEILIYMEDHDSTKRSQVETYLKTKYNHY